MADRRRGRKTISKSGQELISVSPHVSFILVLILISMFLRLCNYVLGIFHAQRTTKCLRNQGRTKGEGWSTAN